MISFNQAFEKFYFDFYLSTVKSGQRKLGMLGFFSSTKIRECQKQTEKQRLVTRIHKSNPGDPAGEWLLYFSKSKKIVEKAIEFSHSESSDSTKNNRRLGKLYGYPKCCIDFFINLDNNLKSKEKREFNYLEKAAANSSLNKFPFLTNRFTLNPFVFHVPCSFNCETTIRLAENYINLAQNINSSITHQILENLKAVVLLTGNSALSIPGYKLKRGAAVFKKEGLKKAFLSEEKIRQYVLGLILDKRSFNFYFSIREMNRMKEGKWKKILSQFEVGEKYEIPLTSCKDFKVLLFS
ncbi:DUF483 domain-containing protein [Patescibacteria group bacterium]|nr:DUF483 domain-containing protein [Patescibacteria group bacterium]